MGFKFSIHIWFDKFSAEDSIEMFGRLLDCLDRPKTSKLTFTDLDVIEGAMSAPHDSHPIWKAKEDFGVQIDSEDIIQRIRPFAGPPYFYRVEGLYDRFEPDNGGGYTMATGYLDLECYNVGMICDQHKYSGRLAISFDNVRYFIKDETNFPSDAPRRINQLPSEIRQNINWLFSFIRRIIGNLEPDILLINCEDGIVNPLNAHLIYRSRVEDVVSDIVRLAELYQRRGTYFGGVDETSMEKSFREVRDWTSCFPRRPKRYFRRLKKQLETFANRYCRPDSKTPRIDNSECLELIESSIDIGTLPVDSGICFYSEFLLEGYVEDVYFSLLERLNEK